MRVWLAAACAAMSVAALTQSAMAQDAAPADPAPAAGAMTSGYSDADLSKFAALAVKINAIHTAGAPDAQAKMVEAVQNSGLEFETYNAIATKMQSDPALQKRVSELAPQPQG